MTRAASFARLSFLIVVAGGAGCHRAHPTAANAPWKGPDDVEELARIFHGAELCPETAPQSVGLRHWACHLYGWRSVDLNLDPSDPPGPVLVAHSVNPGQCRVERFSSRHDLAVTEQAKVIRETFAAVADGPFAGACMVTSVYGGAGGCDVAVFAPRGAFGRGKDCRVDFHRAGDWPNYRDGQRHW